MFVDCLLNGPNIQYMLKVTFSETEKGLNGVNR